MFFVDKYSPKSIDDALFHKDELEKLKIMSKDDAIPHTIFYGPSGSGKKTIISLFLEMIYDEHVHELVETNYTVTGSGNSATIVPIKQSNYHIVIEPNNNNFDRYLIQDVVKAYAKRVPLDVFTAKKVFKTVFINNIDNLSYYAQTSLRRTMEIYSSTCRFIMWSRSLSKVIEPLRSRSHLFRIRAPNNNEMLRLMLTISAKEDIHLTLEDYDNIITKSNGNVKTVLWLLELSKINKNFSTSYDEIIDRIVEQIMTCKFEYIKETKSNREILLIQDFLYKIMITNITGTQIIKDIIDKLLLSDNVSDQCKFNIVEIAATYEHNLIRGRREIIHLEAFIFGIMYDIYHSRKVLKSK
jgi:replication factor C subunit 3/5